MDLAKVLLELKKELANLDAAIVSLERLQMTTRRRAAGPRGEGDTSRPSPEAESAEAADSSGAAASRAKEKKHES